MDLGWGLKIVWEYRKAILYVLKNLQDVWPRQDIYLFSASILLFVNWGNNFLEKSLYLLSLHPNLKKATMAKSSSEKGEKFNWEWGGGCHMNQLIFILQQLFESCLGKLPKISQFKPSQWPSVWSWNKDILTEIWTKN